MNDCETSNTTSMKTNIYSNGLDTDIATNS